MQYKGENMQAEKGNKVKVHYTLKNNDGDVIESSKNEVPIEFVIGDNNVIPGFEKGILGMKVDETKTVTVPVEDGYGPRDEKKTFEFGKENAPGNFEPQVGQMVQLHRPDGQAVTVTVMSKTWFENRKFTRTNKLME